MCRISKFLIGAAMICCASVANAQVDSLWSRTYGSEGEDMALGVVQLPDGGYVIAGFTSSIGSGGTDGYLIRTNSAGEVLWANTYGGESDDLFNDVGLTDNNGIFAAGATYSIGNGGQDSWFVIVNDDGSVRTERAFGGDGDEMTNACRRTSDGGYILAGQTTTFGAGNNDGCILRLDGEGDSLWCNCFGGLFDDKAMWVEQTSDDGFIVSLTTQSYADANGDMWIIKTNSSGAITWSRQYGSAHEEIPYCICPSPDGGYYYTGFTRLGNGSTDLWLQKLDSEGVNTWNRTYSAGLGYECGVATIPSADGGCYVAGGTQNGGGPVNGNMWLFKVDHNGMVEWSETFGGALDESATTLQLTSDGGFVLAGYIGPIDSYNDILLLRTSSISSSGPQPPVVEDLRLMAYPNPFNSSVAISFTLPHAQEVKLCIFDVTGHEVAKLLSDLSPAGVHTVRWDASPFASGLYVVRLAGYSASTTQKIVLLK